MRYEWMRCWFFFFDVWVLMEEGENVFLVVIDLGECVCMHRWPLEGIVSKDSFPLRDGEGWLYGQQCFLSVLRWYLACRRVLTVRFQGTTTITTITVAVVLPPRPSFPDHMSLPCRQVLGGHLQKNYHVFSGNQVGEIHVSTKPNCQLASHLSSFKSKSPSILRSIARNVPNYALSCSAYMFQIRQLFHLPIWIAYQ